MFESNLHEEGRTRFNGCYVVIGIENFNIRIDLNVTCGNLAATNINYTSLGLLTIEFCYDTLNVENDFGYILSDARNR